MPAGPPQHLVQSPDAATGHKQGDSSSSCPAQAGSADRPDSFSKHLQSDGTGHLDGDVADVDSNEFASAESTREPQAKEQDIPGGSQEDRRQPGRQPSPVPEPAESQACGSKQTDDHGNRDNVAVAPLKPVSGRKAGAGAHNKIKRDNVEVPKNDCPVAAERPAEHSRTAAGVWLGQQNEGDEAVYQAGRSASSGDTDWNKDAGPSTDTGLACASAWGYDHSNGSWGAPWYDDSIHNPKDMAPPWPESWWAHNTRKGKLQIPSHHQRAPPYDWYDREGQRGPDARRAWYRPWEAVITINEWGSFHTEQQGVLSLDDEYWELRHFKSYIVHAVKRYQGLSRGTDLWGTYVRYHFTSPERVLNPWLHEPRDLLAFLIEAGVQPPDDPLLQLMNYYTTSDFDVDPTQLSENKPGEVVFDKDSRLHLSLWNAVKDIQRQDSRHPSMRQGRRHTWGEFTTTFCIPSKDPQLAHPHVLKAYIYHVRNRLWLQ